MKFDRPLRELLSGHPRTILDTKAFTDFEVESLFRTADRLASVMDKRGRLVDSRPLEPKTIALLFFEPSTRTRVSFQSAALRLGHQPLVVDLGPSSSMVKGESPSDTILNVLAMGPDAMVVRYGPQHGLDALLPQLPVPVISGGGGVWAHPSQALLDAWTIRRELGSLSRKRVVIFGDIIHSRVARSNAELLSRLGTDVTLAGPAALLPAPEELAQWGERVSLTLDLDEALEGADVVMGLRVQLERHTQGLADVTTAAEYLKRYGLSRDRLSRLNPHALILHPGPINYGTEFSTEVAMDPRSRVLAQVECGVMIRAALLERCLDAIPEKKERK
jgi:aspartate carbamoyltransferase catalytic subunit